MIGTALFHRRSKVAWWGETLSSETWSNLPWFAPHTVNHTHTRIKTFLLINLLPHL